MESSRPRSDTSQVLVVFIAGVVIGLFAAVKIVPGSVDQQQPQYVQVPANQIASVTGGGEVVAGDDFGGGDENGDGDLLGIGGSSEESGGSDDAGGASGTTTTQPGQTGSTSGGGTQTGGTQSGGTQTGDSSSGGTQEQAGQRGGGVEVGGGADGGGGSAGGTGGSGGGGGSGCRPSAGDTVSTGVTASEIRVASTVVLDGPGASLLSSSPVGMRAVFNKVNREGGICGRRIALTTVNDSWNAARGQGTIRRFIEEGYFALPVVPSSEGLGQAILAGDIKGAGIPVVGTDGMRIDQYQDPWVWPVATATVSTMRIIAQHAYDNGARTFGIVYDRRFRFGIEGADAFKAHVNKLGGTIKGDLGIEPDQTSYGSEANRFNGDCENQRHSSGCDAVVLLLVPSTADTWRGSNSGENQGRGKTTYGHQTLFTEEFAVSCGGWCNGMIVFTGYNPPISPLDRQAGVAQYVQDVQAERSGIDYQNQFLQGAYLGAQVFVDAAARCSPNLTRECLQQTLNSVEFRTDLASNLSWRANQRHANKAAQAFRMEATGGSFNGFQYMRTGFLPDPDL